MQRANNELNHFDDIILNIFDFILANYFFQSFLGMKTYASVQCKAFEKNTSENSFFLILQVIEMNFLF